MQDHTPVNDFSENLPSDSTPTAENHLDRAGRRIKAATDVLRTLLRDFYTDRFGAVPEGLADLPVQFRFRAHPHQEWALEFDPPMADQLLPQLEDAQATLDVYLRGHLFCFRCVRADCEHARPPNPLSVFAGFDSTGRPEWRELGQALLDARHEGVDRLYAKPARAVAAVQLGSQLRGDQLAAFGRSSKTYAVLGQVVAGYFTCPPPASEPQDTSDRVALTIQVVEARGAGGGIRLHLNTLATMPDGSGVDERLATGWEAGLDRARRLAARALEEVEAQARAARQAGRTEELREAMRRVPGILRRLCENIERGERQHHRRTRHAEARREEQRPTHKAFDDARQAGPDRVFFDEKSRTVMVHGAKGRAHAFNTEGRHVTSFTLKPGGLDLRVRTRRWRPASPEEFTSFKSLLPAG